MASLFLTSSLRALSCMRIISRRVLAGKTFASFASESCQLSSLSSRLSNLSLAARHPALSTGRPLSTSCAMNSIKICTPPSIGTNLLSPNSVSITSVRTRILYGRLTGKPETVEDVVKRFFRLHNGLWIRAKAGRHKRRWRKKPYHVHRLKFHVVCNRWQCQLLDHMVNREYRMPKFYADDPYAVYHRKSNLPDYRYQPPKFLP